MQAGQLHVAAVPGESLVYAKQHAQAVAGDVIEPGAVDDDLRQTGVDELFQVAHEAGGVVLVDPAVGAEDQHAAVDLVIVEFHRRVSIRDWRAGAVRTTMRHMAKQNRDDVPLNVPEAKEAEQYSLEMTPEDLDRQNDPREAQQTNRVILSGQGTAQN